MMIFLIIGLSLLSIYLILILNRKYLGIEHSHKKVSILSDENQNARKKIKDSNLFFNIGKALITVLPANGVAQLEKDIAFLSRDEKYLFVTTGQAFVFGFAFLLVFLSTHNVVFITLAFIVFFGLFAEIPLSVSSNKKIIDNSIPHVVSCLKVLVVKTETPLSNALDIVAKGLPQFLLPMKTELLRLLQKAEKTNMREALMEWRTESGKFKDFISLLISVNEGASKSALANYINNFLAKAEDDLQENIKNKAENLQLFMMGPVIIMFLIVLQPMMSAVNYTMRSGGF